MTDKQQTEQVSVEINENILEELRDSLDEGETLDDGINRAILCYLGAIRGISIASDYGYSYPKKSIWAGATKVLNKGITVN